MTVHLILPVGDSAWDGWSTAKPVTLLNYAMGIAALHPSYALICPTGKSMRPAMVHLSSPIRKNIPFRASPKSVAYPVPSRLSEGRFAIVTDVRREAMDAGGASDEGACLRTAKSCGPDASTLAFKSRGSHSADDGDKRARSPGRARRKPLKPLRGECRVFPV